MKIPIRATQNKQRGRQFDMLELYGLYSLQIYCNVIFKPFFGYFISFTKVITSKMQSISTIKYVNGIRLKHFKMISHQIEKRDHAE